MEKLRKRELMLVNYRSRAHKVLETKRKLGKKALLKSVHHASGLKGGTFYRVYYALKNRGFMDCI